MMPLKNTIALRNIQAKSNQHFVSFQCKFAMLNTSLMIAFVLVFSALFATANAQSPSTWISSNTGSSCSKQAANFFFLAPYSARTDPSEEGGTVYEVANDGFTALGLSYHTGDHYEVDLSEWLNTDLCLIHRLWPTRTVLNKTSPDYVGPVGSLVKAANKKVCNSLVSPTITSQPLSTTCEEIADASDAQMDEWVNQIENEILQVINDPSLNQRIVAWYLGPEELRGNITREKELLQRIYKAVKKLDPLNRPAWMYFPGHLSTENLLGLTPWMDSLSMGIYPHLANNVHNRIFVRHALEQMTAANALFENKSFGNKKTILPVLEMFESDQYTYSEQDAALIPEFVRHDAYAAFANGADGVLIYSMGFRSGFTNYDTYYDAWSEIAHQLTNWGLKNVFQHGQVQNDATAIVTAGQSKIVFDAFGFKETYPSLSVRDWFFKGRTYILIVNSSEGDVSFRLENIPLVNYRDFFTNKKHNAEAGYIDLLLEQRGVILLVSQYNPPGSSGQSHLN